MVMYASEVQVKLKQKKKKNYLRQKINDCIYLNSILNIDIFNSLSSWPITGYVIQTVKPLAIEAYTKSSFAFWKKSLS